MMSRALLLLALTVSAAGPANAQDQPYKVFDTRPVITEGPYLVATGETTATIVWLTDTPSHARVRYGTGDALSEVAEPQVDGMVPVGTRHVVHLEGLSPGTTYSYEVVATRVVKLKAYWPDKGMDARSGPHRFTTFDRRRPTVTFSVVTDTHEDRGRISALNQAIDWEGTEFLAHLGDAFHWIDTEEHLFSAWLRPTIEALGHSKPLFFARGNHELRGPFARRLSDYVPTFEGRFYYARDMGPVHVIVLDTAEDKPDDTNVYADLNRTAPYRAAELKWFKEHVETDERVFEASFRVILMHAPGWGWLADGPKEWMDTANEADVDLVIAGHRHRFVYTPPGPDVGHTYHLLVLDQDQVARVSGTVEELSVVVTGLDGEVVHTLTIPRQGPRRADRMEGEARAPVVPASY
jgi:predicted phosphodiesterase